MLHTLPRLFVTLLSLALYFCLAVPPALAWYPLNDTGVQFCGEADDGNNDPCTGSEPQGQDAHYGRDDRAKAGTLSKVGAGAAGFDFTKISNIGQELPATAQLGSGPNDWACTRDNVTGIIWEVQVDNLSHLRHKDHRYTWYFPDSPTGDPGHEGETYTCGDNLGLLKCNTKNYTALVNQVGLCGNADWRVPTVKELESIVYFGREQPAIDQDYFPNTAANDMAWSASPYASKSGSVWVVHFYSGNTTATSSFNAIKIRLARGGQSLGPSTNQASTTTNCLHGISPSNPDSIYTDHGDGTVTDARTGLMWKRCLEGQTWDGITCTGVETCLTWADALGQAASSTFANHTDWRLPNVKELRSLVEECRFFPSINDTIFPATPSLFIWSATPNVNRTIYDTTSNAWGVNFDYGSSLDNSFREFNYRVRLVRDGQSIDPLPQPVTDFEKANIIFDWVEALFPVLFPSGEQTQTIGDIFYRYYTTDVFLATYLGDFYFIGQDAIIPLGSVNMLLPYAISP